MRHNPPVYVAGELESILLARVMRALAAKRAGRIHDSVCAAIVNRVRLRHPS